MTIGYLERAAAIATQLTGRWSPVAALIAVKGRGRFRNLYAEAAAERISIGRLVNTLVNTL